MTQHEWPEDPASSSPTPDAATTGHVPSQPYTPGRFEPAAPWPAEPAAPQAGYSPASAGRPPTSPMQPAMPDTPTSPLPPTAAYPTAAPSPAGAVPAGYPAVSGPGVPPAHGYPTPPDFAAQPAYPGSAVAGSAIASPPKRRKALLVTMSCLAVVFFLAAAATTYGFIDRNNAYHKQARIVAQRNSTISNDSGQINTLKSQLATAQAQNSKLQQQATGSGNQVSELKNEKAALSKCIHAVEAFFDAAGSSASDATVNKYGDKMESACAAAEKYLD